MPTWGVRLLKNQSNRKRHDWRICAFSSSHAPYLHATPKAQLRRLKTMCDPQRWLAVMLTGWWVDKVQQATLAANTRRLYSNKRESITDRRIFESQNCFIKEQGAHPSWCTMHSRKRSSSSVYALPLLAPYASFSSCGTHTWGKRSMSTQRHGERRRWLRHSRCCQVWQEQLWIQTPGGPITGETTMLA